MSLRKIIGVLRSLIMETIVFTSGIRSAEADNSAAILLAGECIKHVSEAIVHLSSVEWRDEYVERAIKELKNAKELFKSVITGEQSPDIIRRCVFYGIENRSSLILDIAHNHVHRAIDLLRKSENCRVYSDVLELLTKARRESAPTTLYRLAYEISKKRSLS